MKHKEGYQKMRRLLNKKMYIILGVLCCVILWMQLGINSFAFTRTTGEVTGSSVKVRASASTNSEMVASLKAGDKLDVTDAVNGTDGKVWYKILVNATDSGYVRSDFVTLATGPQEPSSTVTTTPTPQEPSTNTEVGVVTPMEMQSGHTSTNNVKVRQEATTSSAEVARVNQDRIFNITGSAKDADGKVWYQISYIDDGKGIYGFIRSDLVTLVASEQEQPEEELQEEIIPVIDPDEQTEPEEPVPTTNYEAVYTEDENGQYVWYLYDRTAGQRYKIDQLLKINDTDKKEIEELSDANFGLKIGLIISICLLVMLIVAVVFYLLKMHDEEEQAVPYRRQAPIRNNTQTRSNQATRTNSNVRPQTLGKMQEPPAKKTQSEATARTVAKQPVPPANAKPQQQKTSWKAKNFLDDNDEFEFGFLDFDDDDE